jgi:dolichol-phosphate mannosyltransferase
MKKKLTVMNSLIIIQAHIKQSMTVDGVKKMGGFSLFAKQAGKYYSVGASGVLVNLGILYILTDIAGFWYLASQVIAISISISSNFLFNRFWTFRDSIEDQRNSVMYVKFLIVSLIGMGIQLGITFALVENAAVYYMYAAGAGIAIAGAINYIVNRRWTFGIKF